MPLKTPQDKAKVYYWDLQSSFRAPFETRMRRLLKTAGLAQHLQKNDLVALKIHFGEKGCTSFISPLFLKPIISFIRKSGAKAFFTDSNTLYAGHRAESVSHALLAAEHGFNPNVLGAPVLIADGLRGEQQVQVPSPGPQFSSCYLAALILQADYILNISHFKGHELSGFGGALKNLCMGCASKQGKMQQHCGLGPKVRPDKCQGCGQCVQACAPGALALDKQGRICLQTELCTGCAHCLSACENQALKIDWGQDRRMLVQRMAEYAAVVLQNLKRPALHINFLMQITPVCDCAGYSPAPICPDLGLLAGFDPVALDQASLDLVNKAAWSDLAGLEKQSRPNPDLDKFQALHPGLQSDYLLQYAESLGAGRRDYDLVQV